jgi:cytochrome c oxidase subunit 4
MSTTAQPGLSVYIKVYLLLMLGLAATVGVAFIPLGRLNLPVALAIAFAKATLVVLFFMHMSDSHGANRLVFVVSLLFLLVLLAGVFGDLLTRAEISLPSGAPTFDPPEIPLPPRH